MAEPVQTRTIEEIANRMDKSAHWAKLTNKRVAQLEEITNRQRLQLQAQHKAIQRLTAKIEEIEAEKKEMGEALDEAIQDAIAGLIRSIDDRLENSQPGISGERTTTGQQ